MLGAATDGSGPPKLAGSFLSRLASVGSVGSNNSAALYTSLPSRLPSQVQQPVTISFPVQRDVLANMIDALWRPTLPALSSLLVRCPPDRSALDSLGSVLLKAYQQFIYSAGMLNVGVARDKMLSSLCEFTLIDPPEDPQSGLSASEGLLVARPGGKTAALLYTMNPDAVVPRESLTRLTSRNVACLKALFHVAHRLSPVLPLTAWLHVVDVLNCLDRLLLSPYTTSEHDQVSSRGRGSCLCMVDLFLMPCRIWPTSDCTT